MALVLQLTLGILVYIQGRHIRNLYNHVDGLYGTAIDLYDKQISTVNLIEGLLKK